MKRALSCLLVLALAAGPSAARAEDGGTPAVDAGADAGPAAAVAETPRPSLPLAEQSAIELEAPSIAPRTRGLRIGSWIGLVGSIALLTVGGSLALATQSRGDEVTYQLRYVDARGLPKVFDAAAQAQLDETRRQGELYNGLSIGFLSASAAAAIVTTILFAVKHRREQAWARGRR